MAKYTSKQDLSVGKRFAKICDDAFPGKSRAYIADKLGVANEGRVRLFEGGGIPETPVLSYLDRQGYSIEWLLINKGEMRLPEAGRLAGPAAPAPAPGGSGEAPLPRNCADGALDRLAAPPGSRRMNVLRRGGEPREWWEEETQDWTVRGAGAADDSGGTRVPGHDDLDDPENPPEGMTLVPVIGDSMAPLLLSGQYAMVDKNREGFEADGGIVVVVVAGDEAAYETYIKRCFRENDRYILESIGDYEDIVVPAANCRRMWPVIGAWFAGKGRSPRRKGG